MRWKGWDRILLKILDRTVPAQEREVAAIAPLIISASRSTDIPAFYGDWFMDRLKRGYVKWKSPFVGSPVYVSFEKARVFVFWSKNPAPFENHLDELDRLGQRYYFLFTLNDYEAEGLEPNVPSIDERIATFIQLSQRVGKGRVVWRYDPLVLSDRISVNDLLEKIRSIGNRLHMFTERLVISFIDIAKYQKAQRNLKAQGFTGVREFTDNEVTEFCEDLRSLNERWRLSISACGERRDLSAYGIEKGQCINYNLLIKEFGDDPALMEFFKPDDQQTISGNRKGSFPGRHLKDPGQRSTCGCIVSKDIGQYNTCMHLCAYCYANASAAGVRRNYARYLEDAQESRFRDAIAE